MYLYVGRVEIRGLAGYLWILGNRIYLKTGWRPRDTHYLGNLSDIYGAALKIARLAPKPVNIRKAVSAAVKALLMAKYVASRCRDSPTWRIRTWELLDAVETALAYIQHAWPWAVKLARKPPWSSG